MPKAQQHTTTWNYDFRTHVNGPRSTRRFSRLILRLLSQVSRILGPIVSCLEQLAVLHEKDDHIKTLIDTGYGGLEKLKKDILFDFFRSAFDGSGADNFFDAGRYAEGWIRYRFLGRVFFYPFSVLASKLCTTGAELNRGVTGRLQPNGIATVLIFESHFVCER